MKPQKQEMKRKRIAVFFILFGIVFALCVFTLTDEWPRGIHALVIGAISIALALYIGSSSRHQPGTEKPKPSGQE
jgi:uncharacterized BrkB/YihY/UPF0761 family membrane protein